MKNWTTPTVTPRYFAGEHTNTFDSQGPVPARTCKHLHRSLDAAEKCAALFYPFVVYKQQAGKISRASYGA